MTLIWKEPPGRWAILNEDVIAELRSRPGEWALIREWPYRHGQTMKPPPADIEIRWVDRARRGQAPYSALYARARPKAGTA